MEILAHEISCTDGDVKFIPEVPVECSAGGPSQEPKRTIGIIRRIDELGRIVIPKEFRSRFSVKEMDPFEIFAHDDGSYLIVPYREEPWKGLTFLFQSQRDDPELDTRSGQLVGVISEIKLKEQDNKDDPLRARFKRFRVRFEDGFVAEVYSSELTLYSM